MKIAAKPRAVIYARISKSDSEVDKVENQVRELRGLAEKSGYDVVDVIEDNDVSAYLGKESRLGFANLISGLRGGKYDVVLATEHSRLTRGSAAETELFAAACQLGGAILHTRTAGVQDLSSSMTRALIGILDVISGLESSLRIERQRARNRADLEGGIPLKGLRAFGWEKDRVTIVEKEAKVIRDAYEEILSNKSTIWATAKKWNDLGIKTDPMMRPRKSRTDGEVRMPRGLWTAATVRSLLLRPSNAGILVSNGLEMPQSKIQPIVTRRQLEQLRQKISSNEKQPGPKPRYLLGGLLVCPCGDRMHATSSVTKRKGSKAYRSKIYRCRLYGVDKDHKHANISLQVADQAVSEWVVSDIALGLRTAESTESLAVEAIETDLIEARDQLTHATSLLLDRTGDMQLIKSRIRDLEKEIEVLEQDRNRILASHIQSSALRRFEAEMEELTEHSADQEIQEGLDKGMRAWHGLSLEDKRLILKGEYRISVKLGGRGAERLAIERLSRRAS